MRGLLDFLQSASNAVAGNVAGPVDLIGMGLNKIGVPVKEPVGGSEWMKRKGLMRDVEQSPARVLGETAGLLGPAMVTQFAPQIAKGLLKVGENLAAPRKLNPQTGAIVWHGSPHKFDKFDSSKIGTGEGAQAYGHGLYLAESPATADFYKKNLSGALKTKSTQLNNLLVSSGGDLDGSISQLKLMLAKSPASRSGIWSEALEEAETIKATGGIRADTGNLYKVDLPDDQIAKMLDWDKPLSQQPKGAQDALARLDPDMYHPAGGDYDPTELGQMIYQRLAQKGQDAAATSMRGAGIPGIRYLDGGSRGAGSGTSNFVVFPGNEGLLKILERNGQGLIP